MTQERRNRRLSDYPVIRGKVGKVGLLELAKQLRNVSSEACKKMGYSRDSFYRFQGSRFRPLAGY
jgi:hypothetical protein